MDREQVKILIFETLEYIQKLNGEELVDLSLTTVPVEMLPSFDSLTSVEATVMLEEKLGCGELKCDSIFISDDGTKALSIEEAIEKVENLISSRRENDQAV